MGLLKSLFARIAVLAIVLVVAAGAGWYFFIREENSAQKEAAAVTDDVLKAATASAATGVTSAATAPPASASVAPAAQSAASSIGARSYKLVEGQSSAWYLAPEKLASLPSPNTAKGTTKGVTGEFHFAAGGLNPAKPTTFTVDLRDLTSDQGMRDRRVQSTLETARFPTATFTATKLTGLPAEFTATDTVMQITGTFALHGVQKEVTWELKVKQDQGILSGLATIEFKYSDFNITKPDIGGFVTVEDEVTIQVQLFAAPS